MPQNPTQTVPADLPEGQESPSDPWSLWFEKLEACRSLQEGWNGYTAPAPNEAAIQNAKTFLEAMRSGSCEPTRVAPSAMGGVAVTRRAGDRKAFVEFYNDGRVYVLFSERPDQMRVAPITTDVTYQKLLAEMREYLNV